MKKKTHWRHPSFRGLRIVERWEYRMEWIRRHDYNTRASCGAFLFYEDGTHVLCDVTCKSCLAQYKRMAAQAFGRQFKQERLWADVAGWMAARGKNRA